MNYGMGGTQHGNQVQWAIISHTKIIRKISIYNMQCTEKKETNHE